VSLRRITESGPRYAAVVAALLLPACLPAQDDSGFHKFTAEVAGAPADFASTPGFKSGFGLLAGGGVRIPGHSDANSLLSPPSWSLYLTANFMYDQLGISGDTSQIAANNPQIPTLLSASSGKAKFYTTTFDPMVRFRIPKASYLNFYVMGGAGWMRRTLDFTGTATTAGSLVPSSPVVVLLSGNSAAYDFGGGVSVRPYPAGSSSKAGGTLVYLEGRRVHGLGINASSTFWPLSVGLRW
jgi:hypothetical protein